MDRKQVGRLMLMCLAAGAAILAMPSAAFAQEAARAAEHATFLTSSGAAGIGRIGGSAVESMARQPAAAGQISTAMIITAAMIEGATLFAVVVGMLAVLKA